MKIKTTLLDSSVWIEIFDEGPLLDLCRRELQSAQRIIVPTLVLYEVYRKIASQVSEDQALLSISFISQNVVEDLTQDVALTAADFSLQHQLGMADSLILAHAFQAEATLVTLDNDFRGIPGTKVLA